MTDPVIKRKKMFRCAKCGALLPYGAKFCDVCGEACDSVEHIKFERRKRMIPVLIVSALLALFLFYRIYILIAGTKAVEDTSLTEVEDTITPDEYNSIELGMNLEQVEDIIGCKGKEIYDSSYNWPGEYYDPEDPWDFYAQMRFNEGKLTEKKEYDILDGEEISKVREIAEKDPGKLDAPFVTARQLKQLEEGMPYEEVISILGGEGQLFSSESQDWTVYGYEEGPKAYVYRCKTGGRDATVVINVKNKRLYIDISPMIINTTD